MSNLTKIYIEKAFNFYIVTDKCRWEASLLENILNTTFKRWEIVSVNFLLHMMFSLKYAVYGKIEKLKAV